jgi:AcrR family transcriptional regulator
VSVDKQNADTAGENPAEQGVEGLTSLRFDEMLGQKSLDRSLPKRVRTRYLILTIVARCIQEDATRNPTVEFVLDQAGLSRGTFYNYFKDIDDSVFEMLLMFFEYIGSSRVSSSRKLSSYDAILEANTWYCHAYAANANLFAAVHRNAALSTIRQQRNGLWVQKVVHVAERRRGRPFGKDQRTEYEGVVRLLITMTIETLRERFVSLDELLCHSFTTADQLASKLSDIWHRTMMDCEDSYD